MIQIDIDRLSEAELIDLNHRIVERLRFLGQMRAHARMLEFRIGDRVLFSSGRTRPGRRYAHPIQQEDGDSHCR